MQIGPYTLNAGVIWMDEGREPAIAQDIQETLLGTVVINTTPVQKQTMTVGTKDMAGGSRGYWTRQQFEYLRSMEASGSPFVLTYRGVNYTVVVVAGSINFRPLKEIEAVSSDDYYIGTVKLQQV